MCPDMDHSHRSLAEKHRTRPSLLPERAEVLHSRPAMLAQEESPMLPQLADQKLPTTRWSNLIEAPEQWIDQMVFNVKLEMDLNEAHILLHHALSIKSPIMLLPHMLFKLLFF